jgi:hypothetical protein
MFSICQSSTGTNTPYPVDENKVKGMLGESAVMFLSFR